jgi:predicted dehydrogenase
LGNELRIGVVGLGKMGLLHASLINTIQGARLAAVCEKSSLVERFAKKILPEVLVAHELAQLTGKGLDAIFVTTPIPTHYPLVREIWDRGIADDVFVEKTLALKYDESKHLCALAERSGRTTMVGYQRRFTVTFAKAKELLEQGAVGTPVSFEAHGFSSDFSGSDEVMGSPSRGGVFRDLGSHAIDLALWFFGDLKAELSGGLLQDGFRAMTEDGLRGEFRASWSLSGYRMPEIGVSVEGTEGSLKANDDMVELASREGAPRRWFRQDLVDGVPFLLGGAEYYRQDETFLRLVRDDRGSENSFLQASRVDRIIEEAGVQ